MLRASGKRDPGWYFGWSKKKPRFGHDIMAAKLQRVIVWVSERSSCPFPATMSVVNAHAWHCAAAWRGDHAPLVDASAQPCFVEERCNSTKMRCHDMTFLGVRIPNRLRRRSLDQIVFMDGGVKLTKRSGQRHSSPTQALGLDFLARASRKAVLFSSALSCFGVCREPLLGFPLCSRHRHVL